MTSLDNRMKAAGMMTIKEMMSGTPMDKWHHHTGVTDIESFSQWVDMKYEEVLTLQATMQLSDDFETDELYEWVIAHVGVLNAVRVNLKYALGGLWK